MQSHLSAQLMAILVDRVSILHRTFYILTDIEGRTRQMTVPPMNQFIVVGSLVSNLPIQLRHAIVHPAIGIPKEHIGIELVVILQAIGLTAVRIAFLITIDTERRHAKLHPRLCGMDGFVDLLDEQVDIIAAPVATVLNTI